MHMKSASRLLVASVFGTVASAGIGASLTSQSCAVVGNASSSLVWKTVFESTSDLALMWPAGATSARLTVSVGGAIRSTETITDTTLAAWPFVVPALPETAADECVYDLTLEYLDAQSAVVKTQAASLGLVRGTDGRTARFVRDGKSSAKWPRLKSGTAVLPIPDGATTLAVDDGTPVSVDAPGWHYLKASGVHELVLLVGADAWAASVEMGIKGLSVIVR